MHGSETRQPAGYDVDAVRGFGGFDPKKKASVMSSCTGFRVWGLRIYYSGVPVPVLGVLWGERGWLVGGEGMERTTDITTATISSV